MVVACNQQKRILPEQWNEKELNEWYNKGEWKKGWGVQPDESVNRNEFAVQYFQNPERWEKAFTILKEENLADLEPGRYELEGTDLFVNVNEYQTKNEKDARFEAHRQYADIQYVVFGEEKIGIMPLENTTTTVSYNNEKDVVFLSAGENNYRLATPEKFFVFFPNDAHCPGVKTDENINVRKVVVKVRID